MKHRKSQETEAAAGVALLDPPADPVGAQEAIAESLAARLKDVEGKIARANSAYLASARAVATGQRPELAPDVALGAIGPLQIERDGLTAAHVEAKAKLAALYGARQGEVIERARAAHAAEFAALAREMQDATESAERHWEALAADLWAMAEVASQLAAERFQPEQGGNLVGASWQRIRTIRGRMFAAGRRMNLGSSVEVVAVQKHKGA